MAVLGLPLLCGALVVIGRIVDLYFDRVASVDVNVRNVSPQRMTRLRTETVSEKFDRDELGSGASWTTKRNPRLQRSMRARSATILPAFACAAACLFWTTSAWADGIDLWWFLTRVGTHRHSPTGVVLLTVVVLGCDYIANFMVVGIPAIAWGHISARKSAAELLVFTGLAQALDRAGMLIGAAMILPFAHTFQELHAALFDAAVANFFVSGVLIWLLARHYLVRRWGVGPGRGAAVAACAAVLTNPAWAVALQI